MIAVADSGSTKTDWRIVSQNGDIQNFESAGYNPHVVDSGFVQIDLFNHPELKSGLDACEKLFFYGAGCSSSYLNSIVERGIRQASSIGEIEIMHDLLGSARATWNGRPAVTSILGTGSSTCYYDGSNNSQLKPSLGFILGDEGAGRDLGGEWLKAVMYKDAPDELVKAFYEAYNPQREDFVTLLYKQSRPNRYLAGFTPFLLEHKDHNFVRLLVANSFKKFTEIHLLPYKQTGVDQFHFVGSIAHFFQDILKETLSKENIPLGQILQKPIDGLVDYHIKTK